MVSVDGFRPAAVEQLRADGELEHFARLQAEGVWTHNARTDFDWTYTVPNHVSMVTGRGVEGGTGHNYTSNGNPAPTATLQATKGSYVASAFDVAHDHGLTTAIHRSKSKLAIIDQSYTEQSGAEDVTGEDNGKAKIDTVRFSVTNNQAGSLVDLLEADLLADPVHLTFLHLVDPDPAGHGGNWESPGYFDAVRRIDAYVGRLLALVEANAPYAGHTTIILTADHGGEGAVHSDQTNFENYTIPFYVWGADVPEPGDLYAINSSTRLDPGMGRPEYSAASQPIRSGDIGNLALDLLGLPAIPGSTINASQDLHVSLTPQSKPQLNIAKLPSGAMQLSWTAPTPATVQIADDLGAWDEAPGTWPSDLGSWVDEVPPAGRRYYRVTFE